MYLFGLNIPILELLVVFSIVVVVYLIILEVEFRQLRKIIKKFDDEEFILSKEIRELRKQMEEFKKLGAKKTDYDTAGERRFTACGWCPEESWQEGFLFAIELLHLCQVAIDPVERIELLEIACALQLLRSLSAQSARYNDWLQKYWKKTVLNINNYESYLFMSTLPGRN